jgi:hypothetical protein
LHRGPVRGFFEDPSYRPSCAQIAPLVPRLDAVLEGIEFILVRMPDAGELLTTMQNGAEVRGFKSTQQGVAPVQVVVYYRDDGMNLHGMHVRRA